MPDGTLNPVTANVRQRVEALRGPGDMSAMWPGKLEACLGVPPGQKLTPEWQAANTDPKPLAQMQMDHPHLMATCGLVRSWILA
jgi:hypothetical protein